MNSLFILTKVVSLMFNGAVITLTTVTSPIPEAQCLQMQSMIVESMKSPDMDKIKLEYVQCSPE